jgi:hypothetical protein
VTALIVKQSRRIADRRHRVVAGTIVSFGCLAMSKSVVSDRIGAVPA